jgi:hypothetical protein
MPVKALDGGTCVIFNLGSDDEPAEVIWLSILPMTVEIGHAAQVVIKRKMLKLGFFYTGVGPNHAELTHEWSMWYKELGFAQICISRRARDALENKIVSWRGTISKQWKAFSVWTEENRVNMSSTPSKTKR